MVRRSLHNLSAVAVLAAAFGVVGGPAQAQGGYALTTDDTLLFELHSNKYKLGETIRGYQTAAGGACVDFGDLIQAMDLPLRLDRKSRRATGWLFAESETFVLDREANTVQNVNTSRPLAAAAVIDSPEGWCVDTKALSGWFGVTFRPDVSNQVIHLETDRKLPFLQAIERRSRAARLRSDGGEFDLSKLPRSETPYHAWRTPSLDVLLRAKWQSTSRGASRSEYAYEMLATGEVLHTSYQARIASENGVLPGSMRLQLFRKDPAGHLLGPLRATVIAAGDVETPSSALTGQSAVGRGIYLTNRPMSTPSRFGMSTLRGELPNGWDAELYRNGELLAFQASRPDGRYEFRDVGLLIGDNNLEVVLYGPQGQIRRESSQLPVGAEAVPAGKTWYWAGALQTNRDLIEFGQRVVDPLTGWRWGVGVERGIDKRTSVGLETQSIVLNGRRETYIEANVRRAVGPMLVQLSGAQQLGRGRAFTAQALGKVRGVHFRAETLWIDGDFHSEAIRPRQSREFGFDLSGGFKLGTRRIPWQAAISQKVDREGTKVNEWYTRLSFNLRQLSLSGVLSGRQETGPKATGTGNGLTFALIGNTRLRNVRLRGSGLYRLSGTDPGFEKFNVTAETRLGRSTDLRLELEHGAKSRTSTAKLALSRDFKHFTLQGEAQIDSRRNLGLGLSMALSLGPDPVDGGWRVSREKLARDGEAVVTVFRDENGDGLRQEGEEGVEDVAIEAGFRHSDRKTAKNGRAVIDGLNPFAPVLIGIDKGSLPDPLLQPKGPGMVVVPRPGVHAEVLLPLAPTGEIEGTLLNPDGQPRAGATIELLDPAGRVLDRALSEYDGYFLFDMVPYGDYRLNIAQGVATALGVKAELGVAAKVDRGKSSHQLGTVRMTATAPPPKLAAQ